MTSPADVGTLLVVFIAVLVFFSLVFLGIIRFPSKRHKIKPRPIDYWKLQFKETGLESKIEWYDPNFNGQMQFKHSKYPQPIMIPRANLNVKTLLPDGGTMVLEVQGIGLDGMAYFDKPFYENRNLTPEKFWLIKDEERKLNALQEDRKQPNTSLERTVSEGMNEDYTENIFMEKVRIAEAMAKAKQKEKGVANEPKTEGK